MLFCNSTKSCPQPVDPQEIKPATSLAGHCLSELINGEMHMLCHKPPGKQVIASSTPHEASESERPADFRRVSVTI